MKFPWALLFVLPLSTASAACLHYGTPNVTRTGHIIRGNLQTAPWYHAQHRVNSDYYWSIQTTTPFCLLASQAGDISVRDRREAQVWPASSALMDRLDQFEGKTVQVAGHFMHTEIPHRHSYSIFAVSAIRIVHRVDPNSSVKRTSARYAGSRLLPQALCVTASDLQRVSVFANMTHAVPDRVFPFARSGRDRVLAGRRRR
jgi:hypothetical protein